MNPNDFPLHICEDEEEEEQTLSDSPGSIVCYKYGEITTKTCVAPAFSMSISPVLSEYYGQ